MRVERRSCVRSGAPTCGAPDVAEHQRCEAEIPERTREVVLILPLPAYCQALFEELQRALVLAAVERDVAEVEHGNAEQPGVAQLARKLHRLRIELRRVIPVATPAGTIPAS